ncbi:hypothetical protein DM75_2259 [Burkholderia mallei]|nr:hypothetical protein DM75_2259 [Burkholderia mallei]KOT21002.1 hypothetical protein DM52_1275 [Burkholderia mallei]
MKLRHFPHLSERTKRRPSDRDVSRSMPVTWRSPSWRTPRTAGKHFLRDFASLPERGLLYFRPIFDEVNSPLKKRRSRIERAVRCIDERFDWLR